MLVEPSSSEIPKQGYLETKDYFSFFLVVLFTAYIVHSFSFSISNFIAAYHITSLDAD